MRESFEQLMKSTTPGYGLDYESELYDGPQLEWLWGEIQSGKLETLDRVKQ